MLNAFFLLYEKEIIFASHDEIQFNSQNVSFLGFLLLRKKWYKLFVMLVGICWDEGKIAEGLTSAENE